MLNRELIAKDYVLYVVRYFSAMQTWSKKEIIHEICRKITEAKEDVVRCKDCIHYDFGVCLKIYSDGAVSQYAWQARNPDDFCSYGERKSD